MVAGDEVIVYDAALRLPPKDHDAQVLVLWRNSSENLSDGTRLRNLRLVQSLSAGSDALIRAGFDAAIPLASGRSLHDGPVAEHALALVLAVVRRLDVLIDAQRSSTWDERYLELQRNPATQRHFTLAGAKVTIWGFGSIASRLAPMLALLGATVTGIANRSGERFGFPVASVNDIPEVFAQTDVLISLLPATGQTKEALNARTLAFLPSSAAFVNVGRGTTVCEDALVAALRRGRLRAAALDVMQEEPLRASSPLWTAPNVILTPHAAGNRPLGASKLVRDNVEALKTGTPLRNLVTPLLQLPG